MPEQFQDGEPRDASRASPAAPLDAPVPSLSGASQLPPSPHDAIVAAAVARLRAEADATTDRTRRARLLSEIGEVAERANDEAGAARDYLAAYNGDPSFREPLEALLRLLERRRSLSNLGKLLEALVGAAATPEERARALTQRGMFLADVNQDYEGARALVREATEASASRADLGPAWLALEILGARLGDAQQREEALAGRSELSTDPTWRGLLLIDGARIAASNGDVDRALDLLARARDEGGSAAHAAALVAENVVRESPGAPGSSEARARSRALAEALEARGEMVRDAILDGPAGDAQGVPRHGRSVAYVVDLFLRAADARRSASELGRAAQLTDRALATIADHAADDTSAPTLERIVLTARLRLAEVAGNTALAAELAERRAQGEADGGTVASLEMRIAEQAASEGDLPRALAALSRATERDPTSAPARALKIDMLEGSGDGAAFAEELEDLARQLTTKESRGRALLLAAYVWTTRAKDSGRARAALEGARDAGLPPDTLARFERTLASLGGDAAWYANASSALIEHASEERAGLWLEVARLRLAAGDEAGFTKATAALRASSEDGAMIWSARALEALVAKSVDPSVSRAALEELAANAAGPSKRTLGTACALRAREAGDDAGAIAHLEALAKDDPADPLVGALLGDLLRLADRRPAAAELATAAARALGPSDDAAAAARFLEAGFETWRLGDRGAAVQHFDEAAERASLAGAPVAAWAARGIDVDTVEGRRRAIDAAEVDPALALERFALELALGDADAAARALDVVETDADPELRLAGALGRIVAPPGTEASDPVAVARALDVLANASDDARAAAAAERTRLVRDAEGDAEARAEAAKAWLDLGGGVPAALEWLASAMVAGDPDAEVPARRALAKLSPDDQREALHTSATLLSWVLASKVDEGASQPPDEPLPLVSGSTPAVRLANLELAPPGCDPRRRAAALAELDGTLGPGTAQEAMGLAGWSALAVGDAAAALDVFRAATATRGEDLHAWEGMRTAAEELQDHESYGVACEQLGTRCASDRRGGAFWEQAALAWFELAGAAEPDLQRKAQLEARAERALAASFARDATRTVAFDRLFRRVRDRKDHDTLLELVERRLGVTDDAPEIAKLYWEQARVLREKGDPEGALEALQHVTTFDENHVGALALTGEIYIRRGMFVEAAEKLARLARVENAPPKNRVTAGVTAVDLYENKLARHDLALEVLVALHQAGLSTLPVRERLARSAARTGSWNEATRILEELMKERSDREGRIEAARLALAIHRDRLQTPARAIGAAATLLSLSPTDGEALDLVVGLDAAVRERRDLLERGGEALLMALHESPANLEMQRRLARIAQALGDEVLEQAALSCAIALGGGEGEREQIALYASKKPRTPRVALSESMLKQLLASGDDGPFADLFLALGATLGEALGPTRESAGVTKKDRIDPRAPLALRTEIAQWAGAFGISNFDLYVGGKDALGIQGIAAETPAIVVGPDVRAPLSPTTRARLARELLSLARGTTVARWRDDTTLSAIVVAACNIAKVKIEAPPFAVLAEVERHLGKAIARRTKSVIEPICRRITTSDVRVWAARARASQARAAALAAGDVSVALAEVFGEPVERLPTVARDDLRAHELFRFVLSRPYFELRRELGLEGIG